MKTSPTATIIAALREQRFAACPPEVAHAARRALINWFGCALGGSGSDAVVRALDACEPNPSGAPVYGNATRLTLRDAAFINCLASAIYAFDDTHLPTITHPTGPVAAALLAMAHRQPISGSAFMTALLAGIEIQCKLGNALLLHAPRPNSGLYITGITGPVGAAAAIAGVADMDELQCAAAIGLAATQGAGLRATHGAMSGAVVPAFAAAAGLHAALLASAGFSTPPDVLGAQRGFLDIFAPGCDADAALAGLGNHWEILDVSLKPYPCGVVIHPLLDGLGTQALPGADQVDSVEIVVHPTTFALANRPAPRDMFEAVVSAQHWIATRLLERPLGIEALQASQICDPQIASLRHRITLHPASDLALTAFRCTIRLTGGALLRFDGDHARPSLDDTGVDRKFRAQAEPVLGAARASRLLDFLWHIDNAGTDIVRDIDAVVEGRLRR